MEALSDVLIPVVALVAVFTFVSIAVWSENRSKEREAFHRHETYRRLLERNGGGADEVAALIRQHDEQERLRQEVKAAGGLKLGGLITTAVGISLMVFLYFLNADSDGPIYLVGLVPLAVGLVISYYAFVLAPTPATPKRLEQWTRAGCRPRQPTGSTGASHDASSSARDGVWSRRRGSEEATSRAGARSARAGMEAVGSASEPSSARNVSNGGRSNTTKKSRSSRPPPFGRPPCSGAGAPSRRARLPRRAPADARGDAD